MRFEAADLEQIADLVTQRVVAALADRLAIANQGQAQKLLWTEREAATLLGISAFSLRNYRLRGYVSPTVAKRPISYDTAAIGRIKEFLQNRK